jgi:transposase
MPSLDCIIGLPGVELESANALGSIVVHAKTSLRPPCTHCGAGRSRIKASFTRKLKHTRQGNRLMFLYIRSHKFLCLICERYFNLRIPGVLPGKRSTESFRQEVYEKHHGGISQRLLSRTHGIAEATVERWYRDFNLYRVKELQGRSAPKVLGIDEHFFTRKDGYATTLCDLGKHKIHDVVLGRSAKSLQQPLERIPERYRTRIAVMDLSETYRQIVTNHFPNALIVADRFHVIRLVNHHFLKAWQLLDPTGRKNRGLLSLMRRHERNLKPEQKPKLQSYLNLNPVLKEIYEFKQKLCALLGTSSKRKDVLRPIAHDLIAMINQLRQTTLEPLRTLGETLDKWKDEIGRMLRFSRSNGITEGFHTKMEMLSRRAFGFRNFSNYRLRVLAHCGWDGVFTRVETRQGSVPPPME